MAQDVELVATLRRQLRAQREIHEAFAGIDRRSGTLSRVLEACCMAVEGGVGLFWTPQLEGTEKPEKVLRCAAWHAVHAGSTPDFIRLARETELEPGRGIAGYVWQHSKPLWIPDVDRDPRRLVWQAGLGAALAFPVRMNHAVLGVIECLNVEAKPNTAAWLELSEDLGRQIGALLKQQRAQEALAFQAQILENVRDAVIVSDPHGRITYWNRGAEAIFGFSADEMLGGGLDRLYPDPNPDVHGELARISAGEEYVGEWRGRHKSGREIWLNVKTTVMRDAAGNPSGFIGTSKDITQTRKLAEDAASRSRRLQALTASLTRAITPADVATVVASHAHAGLGAAGASVWLLDEALERLQLTAEAGDGALASERVLSQLIPDHLELAEAIRALECHGELRWLRSRHAEDPDRADPGRASERTAMVVPILAGEHALGVILLVAASSEHLSEKDREWVLAMTRQAGLAIERARLYAQEQAARTAMEQANQAKDAFLAMLGHELRNPLSPILTALELMRLRGGNTMQRERETIERQVRHVVRLVDDLLDVSRITRGKIELKRKNLEIGEIVAKAIEMASPLLEQRNHRLHTEIDSPGLVVYGDELRLSQVLSNLLTNAAKYTEPGGHIAIRGLRDENEVVLTVQDSGIGMGPDLLQPGSISWRCGARPDHRAHARGAARRQRGRHERRPRQRQYVLRAAAARHFRVLRRASWSATAGLGGATPAWSAAPSAHTRRR
jgi:PAS domain S-box-containing protein